MQADNPTQTAASTTQARQRLLVLVGGPFPGHDRAVARRILAAARGAEVLVVAPKLAVPGERWIIDLGARERQARTNLRSWIDALADRAESIHGEVGDESPGLAVADASERFAADELLTSLIAGAGRSSAKRRPLERLGRLFAQAPTPPRPRGSRA
jgi:hypothetical protein